MLKKGQVAGMGTFITLLVLTIVGISVALTTINDVVDDTTGTNTATDENVSITNGTTITLDNADGNDIVVDSETLENVTGTAFTKDTNYTIDYDEGTVTWISVNNTVHGDFGNATYEFRDESFVSDEGTRTLLDVIPVLFALAVLLAVVSLGITRFV